MKRHWGRFLNGCVLFCALLTGAFAGNAVAEEAVTPATGSASTGPAADDSSKSVETGAATGKDDLGKDKATTESAAVEETKTTLLRVTVLQNGADNIPIKDARVIVTYEDAREFELKTDEAGVALLAGLPYGKVDVDVISSGRQSDGGTLVLDEPEKALTFRLKPRSTAQ
jgi:hypothetical protein